MKTKSKRKSRAGDPATSGRQSALANVLLGWYARKRRDLPWRKDLDPYRVWISEVMLQQTRVEVVIPRYRRFLERFPDVRTLAAAREEEVVAEWSGLGYYSRARGLHAAARAIAEEHGGEFPRDPAAARALPGVGRYTAGAVLSIAYDLPVPVLDGNVARVLCRLFRIGGDPRSGPVARKLWTLAASLLPQKRAGRFNQALMELGALVCLPGAPRCEECPLRGLCASYRSGVAASYPERGRGRTPEAVSLFAAVATDGKRALLERRGNHGARYLRSLWGFPMVEASLSAGRKALAAHLRDVWGLKVEAGESLGVVRHSITYRRITLEAIRFGIASPLEAERALPDGGQLAWAPLKSLGEDLPASSLALKVRALVLFT